MIRCRIFRQRCINKILAVQSIYLLIIVAFPLLSIFSLLHESLQKRLVWPQNRSSISQSHSEQHRQIRNTNRTKNLPIAPSRLIDPSRSPCKVRSLIVEPWSASKKLHFCWFPTIWERRLQLIAPVEPCLWVFALLCHCIKHTCFNGCMIRRIPYHRRSS